MKNKKVFKANPNALPPLLDDEMEEKRIDSIKDRAYDERAEEKRLKEMRKTDKIFMGDI